MLENIKLLLGINDNGIDGKLSVIIDTVTARLSLLLGGIELPVSMEHIVQEVSIARFNRIGSEGMSSHTVEGETVSFTDDDFAPFAAEIQAFLDLQAESKRGRVMFL